LTTKRNTNLENTKTFTRAGWRAEKRLVINGLGVTRALEQPPVAGFTGSGISTTQQPSSTIVAGGIRAEQKCSYPARILAQRGKGAAGLNG
jgi:hypothetical protein